MWVLGGLAVLATVFRLIPAPRQMAVIAVWSRGLLAICGLKFALRGALPGAAATDVPAGWMWVSNHVSWLDIFALNAVQGAVFVAKSEIRRWPLLGWLVAGAGTIFVERGSRHAIRHVNKVVGQALQDGRIVAVFPEGTTSLGRDLLPFHANLFDPALAANARIQPVVLTYWQHGTRTEIAAYVGDQTLMQNLWCVLSAQGLGVLVELLPVLDLNDVAPVARTRRHDAALAAQDRIERALKRT